MHKIYLHAILIKILSKIKLKIEWDEQRMFQIVQDLDTYIKFHIGDANGSFLREKLRFLHRSLPDGKIKKSLRGLLTFFTRWTKVKIWRKIIDIVKFLAENKLEKPTLKSRPFIVSDRVVGPIDIIPFYKNSCDKMLEIKKET
jgi:hypothetical protein